MKLFSKSNSYWKGGIANLTPHLPSHDEFFELLMRVTSLYEKSDVGYRAKNSQGNVGGLLDFRQSEVMPLIVVPDLHARLYFLKNILLYKLPENFIYDSDATITSGGGMKTSLTVFEALQQNLVRLVCVGDGLHSEMRGRDRWLKAWEEFFKGKNAGRFMKEEMAEGFSLMQLVMECKCLFPNNFHFLKGNHENIESVEECGDFPFHKFAQESLMTRLFTVEYYGDDILYLYSAFEKDLPLAALFENCIVTHAEPMHAYSYKDLVDARLLPDVVRGLIWTPNGIAERGSTAKMLKCFTKNDDSFYFAGHRPVEGDYKILNDGRFIQIHNPNRQNIVLVYPGKKFNPETDVVSVDPKL